MSRLLTRPREASSGEDERWALIDRFAPGRSFTDVGCMWGVHGAYAFHAHARGAVAVVGFDRAPATPEFLARNAELGDPVRFVRGDVNAAGVEALLGRADVVFCSGVLYHMPNPVHTLGQLHRVCKQVLILTSAIIPERAEPQAAIFFPYLDAEARRRLAFRGKGLRRGLDTEFAPEKEYGNWFWGLTPSCIRAMLRTAGFEVLEAYEREGRFTAVCGPAEAKG